VQLATRTALQLALHGLRTQGPADKVAKVAETAFIRSRHLHNEPQTYTPWGPCHVSPQYQSCVPDPRNV